MRRTTRLISLLATLGALGLDAQAALETWRGFDEDSGVVGTQSAAAQASFLAAVNDGVRLDFESSLTGLGIVGGAVTNDATCAAAFCGFNTTAGGSRFLLLSGQGSSATFNFDTGISYFGAFFSGLQLTTGTITFSDGESQSISLPSGDPYKGGTAFVGFSNPGKLITSLTVFTGNDIVAIDDVVYGGGTTPAIPEPGTWALMGLGLCGIVAAKRKSANAGSQT
jgi:hypothetical protein